MKLNLQLKLISSHAHCANQQLNHGAR